MSDFLRTLPVHEKNDRDCECPVLQEFISARAPLASLLDVGAHWSGHTYAPTLRPYVKKHVGVDILKADELTGRVLDDYIVSNVNDLDSGEQFDAVICVSSIEHAGISTYRGDYVKERMTLFRKCLKLSRKHVWFSFPVGQEFLEEGQHALVTADHLAAFESMTQGMKVKERFFYSQGPQAGHPWREHTKRKIAVAIPYLEFLGNQSLCIMEIEK